MPCRICVVSIKRQGTRTLARGHRSCKLPRVKTIPILAIALALSACGHYQNVGVESDPPGAQIYLDGKPVGEDADHPRRSGATARTRST